MSIGNALGNAAATAAAFKQGDIVVTKVPARLRNAPNASGEVVITLELGIHAQITGDSQPGNGLVWWPVLAGNLTGFVAQAAPDGTVILQRYLDLHLPCDKQWQVTQRFGENPEFYSKIPGYAVPLKGHNGMDWGLSVGQNIYAVQDGYIYDIREEPNGFGLHCLIQHEWGASLYAHLSQMLVSKGQPVKRGQPIALSGNSGIGTGAHLHFGLKIYPNDRADGWGGYTDPKDHFNDED